MKKIWIFMLLVLISFYGCNYETAEDAIMADIDDLSLYWQHEVFGEEGRRSMFQFDGDIAFEGDYELMFNYYHIRRSLFTLYQRRSFSEMLFIQEMKTILLFRNFSRTYLIWA